MEVIVAEILLTALCSSLLQIGTYGAFIWKERDPGCNIENSGIHSQLSLESRSSDAIFPEEFVLSKTVLAVKP